MARQCEVFLNGFQCRAHAGKGGPPYFCTGHHQAIRKSRRELTDIHGKTWSFTAYAARIEMNEKVTMEHGTKVWECPNTKCRRIWPRLQAVCLACGSSQPPPEKKDSVDKLVDGLLRTPNQIVREAVTAAVAQGNTVIDLPSPPVVEPMTTKKYDELRRKRFTPEQIAENDARAKRELQSMTEPIQLGPIPPAEWVPGNIVTRNTEVSLNPAEVAEPIVDLYPENVSRRLPRASSCPAEEAAAIGSVVSALVKLPPESQVAVMDFVRQRLGL